MTNLDKAFSKFFTSIWLFIFTNVYVLSILVGEFFPSKFRMENFTNRPIKRSIGSYGEENENFEQKTDRIWHSEIETTFKDQNMFLHATT